MILSVSKNYIFLCYFVKIYNILHKNTQLWVLTLRMERIMGFINFTQ